MPQVATDISEPVDWIARKGNDNTLTFTFTQSGSAFNISTYTFALYVFRLGVDYITLANAAISLTQGSGLTNGGSTGILTAVISLSALSSIPADQYFWKLRVTHPDGTVHDWHQGQFQLNDEFWNGSTTGDQSTSINLGAVSVDSAITIAPNPVTFRAYDASGNVFPSTGGSGTGGVPGQYDFYILTTGGTLDGVPYDAGTVLMALVATPGQTRSNWKIY
jgi:hypothetical protein